MKEFKRKLEPKVAMGLKCITLQEAINLCWKHYINMFPEEEYEVDFEGNPGHSRQYQFEQYIENEAEDNEMTEIEFIKSLDLYAEVLKNYTIIEN